MLQVSECKRITIGMVTEQTESHRVHEIGSYGHQRYRH